MKHLHITTDYIYHLLGSIADPDIPVISITELGLVRQVDITPEGKVIILITPSYSGCPAMTLFKEEIQQVLQGAGIYDFEIKTVLSPAWTTDWLSSDTREKMRLHGIAPPEGKSSEDIPMFGAGTRQVTCPRCGQSHTRMTSAFGSTPCKALWQCNDCAQPFEYFKCH